MLRYLHGCLYGNLHRLHGYLHGRMYKLHVRVRRHVREQLHRHLQHSLYDWMRRELQGLRLRVR